jgi:glutathione S-transferase
MDIMRFFPVARLPCNIDASWTGRPANWHVACCVKAQSRAAEGGALPQSGCMFEGEAMARATLTISSKNYSSWSLRGWLLTKFSGLEFDEIVTAPDDASARAEILLLSSSILVPCLRHDGATVWDTLAIAEYLDEIMPEAGLLPADRIARAHCRSISGEIHSGFTTLRSSLPVNLKGHFPNFKIWSRAQADIDRVAAIWRECLAESGGPFLFGERSMADAMYAPVVTRFATYDVKLDRTLTAYAGTIMAMPEMQQWIEAAKAEPADIEELEVEY